MARPSEYDYDICFEICDRVADGKNIIDILKSDERYPVWTTFRRWKYNNIELQTLYVSSQQDKAIALEKEIDDLGAMLLSGEIDPKTYVALVQTLKWKMAKFYPKVFGDKIDHTTDGKEIKGSNIIAVEIVKPKEEEDN